MCVCVTAHTLLSVNLVVVVVIAYSVINLAFYMHDEAITRSFKIYFLLSSNFGFSSSIHTYIPTDIHT